MLHEENEKVDDKKARIILTTTTTMMMIPLLSTAEAVSLWGYEPLASVSFVRPYCLPFVRLASWTLWKKQVLPSSPCRSSPCRCLPLPWPRNRCRRMLETLSWHLRMRVLPIVLEPLLQKKKVHPRKRNDCARFQKPSLENGAKLSCPKLPLRRRIANVILKRN